ncbi:MAG: type II secretion system minor pseudopilin GspK [Deltaproteobacteria bacterium]|nr:type II secretion system minor pseudopilin GspK [Deltaproteobacteria bacterium]
MTGLSHTLWPRQFKTRRGVALLISLLVTGLLSASALSFIRTANLEGQVADNTYALTQAEIIAQAGLKGAMALLAMDKRDYDALNEPWADFNRFAAMANVFFEEGGFKGKIEDLSRRINLNMLITNKGMVDLQRRAQVERLFALLDLDTELVEPILDWLDADDEPRPNRGAENNEYLLLEKPYPCANGPLETPGQLTLIKGLTPQIVYGSGEKRGLSDLVTAYLDESKKPGRININTADPIILMSLNEDLTQSLAKEIVEYRESHPFKTPEALRDGFGIDPELFNNIFPLISVNSSHFLIRIEGLFRQARVVVTGVVKRDDKGISLIYYKTG